MSSARSQRKEAARQADLARRQAKAQNEGMTMQAENAAARDRAAAAAAQSEQEAAALTSQQPDVAISQEDSPAAKRRQTREQFRMDVNAPGSLRI